MEFLTPLTARPSLSTLYNPTSIQHVKIPKIPSESQDLMAGFQAFIKPIDLMVSHFLEPKSTTPVYQNDPNQDPFIKKLSILLKSILRR